MSSSQQRVGAGVLVQPPAWECLDRNGQYFQNQTAAVFIAHRKEEGRIGGYVS